MYRHGDISFHPSKGAKGEKVEHNGSFVCALGEATGHHHRLTVKNPEDLEIVKDKEGRYFFSLKSEGVLTHEEHKEVVVAPGIYEMKNEREKDWFSMSVRRVID
jgi:hypothetical protein